MRWQSKHRSQGQQQFAMTNGNGGTVAIVEPRSEDEDDEEEEEEVAARAAMTRGYPKFGDKVNICLEI